VSFEAAFKVGQGIKENYSSDRGKPVLRVSKRGEVW